MFLSYVTIWYPLGFRLNTMYGEKSSMIVQGLPHACGGVSKRLSAAILCELVFPTHVGVFLFVKI